MPDPTDESESLSILRLIGVPGKYEPSLQSICHPLQKLTSVAEQNKIALFFLRQLDIADNRAMLGVLRHYEERYENTLNLALFTTNLLENMGVSYTLFKTLKPFPSTPSDIDVLLQFEKNLQDVICALKKTGCKLLDLDNYGATMFSPKYRMNIDITTQVAVSGLIYVDKELLFDNSCKVQLDKLTVQSLNPSAEIVVAAAHSILKEQIFTLADYYTIMLLSNYLKDAAKLSEDFYLKYVFGVTMEMVRQITSNVFMPTRALSREFRERSSPKTLQNKGKFEMPKKLGFPTIATALSKKVLSDPVSQRSLPIYIRSISNPAFYVNIKDHITRKTY
jgi:hypothetical protein